MDYFGLVVLVLCSLAPVFASSCPRDLSFSKVICSLSADPLYCAHELEEESGCYYSEPDTWDDPCDAKTNLSYGCHEGYCYIQCIGPQLGNDEWCYLRKRKVGTVKWHECETDEQCEPSKIGVPYRSQCGKCG